MVDANARARAEDDFVGELERRGVSRIRSVKFRANRRQILSVSRDATTLNLHAGLRTAPPEIIDSLADFLKAPRGSAARAIARKALRTHFVVDAPPQTTSACCGTQVQRKYIRVLYQHFNDIRFGRLLPRNLPLGFSARMKRALGHVRYATAREGSRVVYEIALSVDLMLEANDSLRTEVLLHEMAHVAAWLFSGERGHGPAWRDWARRVGVPASRHVQTPIEPRQPGEAPTTRVPPLPAPSPSVTYGGRIRP